ncbi:hypothetical protein RHGRI_017486 [Rhododendron griersonianum]|uniref:Uncharacterized protein n=1 Tax=Rhododendron griersonianum TaxID=479676 RepID=A0AAV6JXY8_9ERIC|nr:hypothetical protein RHGRI_017486 [Rhododendron griersonianum]
MPLQMLHGLQAIRFPRPTSLHQNHLPLPFHLPFRIHDCRRREREREREREKGEGRGGRYIDSFKGIFVSKRPKALARAIETNDNPTGGVNLGNGNT